ncbi:MAG: peptidoglycan DD-metalloendopeptidase family protein [Lachnospiraceae bacterium]|nr:peptidoglycan DD-metalloendopeptidase family protein [Lachnospiraceae bacterium]
MKKKLSYFIAGFLFITGTLLGISKEALAAESWLWPVPGHTNLSQRFSGSHDGLDISDGSIAGANIVATKSGTIKHWWNDCRHVSAGYQGCNCSYTGSTSNGFGNGVVIQNDDGTIASYAHMMYDSIPQQYRTIGARVTQGAVIGKVGSAGWSTGYHLHFTICSGGDYWKNQINNNPGTINYIYAADTEPPIISNVIISDVNSEGYTVTCTASDNVGVTSVKFPSWNIDIHGGDDAEWLEGTRNGNTFSVRVNIANLRSGAIQGYYATHIYAYDGAGNVTSANTNNGIPIFIDRTPPEISDIFVSDVSETGYTVHCTVTDNTWINRVQFPTWTVCNEQDDIVSDWGTNSLCSGTADGDSYTYRVNISDHNFELGEYVTHIYAYDSAGNFVKGIVPSQVLQKSAKEPDHPVDSNDGSDPGNTSNPDDSENISNPGDSGNIGNPGDISNSEYPGDISRPGGPGNTNNSADTENSNPESDGDSENSNGNTDNSQSPDLIENPDTPDEPEGFDDPADTETSAQTTCIITFDGNGGTNLTRRTITVRRNQMIGSMPSIQRRGYLFKGWYTERTGGIKMSYYTRITKSQTLYARWETVAKPKKAVISSLKKRGKGKFLVKYRKISGSDGYEICYSTNKKFRSSVKKTDTSALSKTVKGLKEKKNYYMRVRAYKTDSTGSKVYGNYSKTKKVKV